MPTSHRFSTRRAALATFAALVLAANAPALAQAPAGGAVKFILPNAAGSGVDTIVRAAPPAGGARRARARPGSMRGTALSRARV